MCSGDNTFNKFSDISNIEIEAAAMGTPSVSSFLLHYYGTEEERKKLGIFTTSENLTESLKKYFEGKWKPGNTRKLIKKYYNWEFILQKNLRIYNQLFREYYNL
jgi:predicted glycosyltransferase